jgi:hypothetical protein
MTRSGGDPFFGQTAGRMLGQFHDGPWPTAGESPGCGQAPSGVRGWGAVGSGGADSSAGSPAARLDE